MEKRPADHDGTSRYEAAGWGVPEALDALHDLFGRVRAEHVESDSNDLLLMETAVIEVAGNVIQHGRPQAGVRWRFFLEVRPGRLEAELADSGEIGGDADAEMPEEDAVTGRGLPLARATLDELTYRRRNTENCWRMVRRTDRPGR